MKIEYMAVNVLRKYNNNPKDHPDEQVKEIANSIERFGFRQPIVVDRNYVVVIGHGRLLAAKKLGIRDVPVTIIDDLTDDEVNALRLVDNKLNESNWDFSMLESELSEIHGIDMSDFGFEPMTDADIENVTRRPETASEPPWNEDDEIVAGDAESAATRPVMHLTPLQATNRDKAYDYAGEQGERLIGERSLLEAERENYKYVCPRCKHKFN